MDHMTSNSFLTMLNFCIPGDPIERVPVSQGRGADGAGERPRRGGASLLRQARNELRLLRRDEATGQRPHKPGQTDSTPRRVGAEHKVPFFLTSMEVALLQAYFSPILDKNSRQFKLKAFLN